MLAPLVPGAAAPGVTNKTSNAAAPRKRAHARTLVPLHLVALRLIMFCFPLPTLMTANTPLSASTLTQKWNSALLLITLAAFPPLCDVPLLVRRGANRAQTDSPTAVRKTISRLTKEAPPHIHMRIGPLSSHTSQCTLLSYHN